MNPIEQKELLMNMLAMCTIVSSLLYYKHPRRAGAGLLLLASVYFHHYGFAVKELSTFMFYASAAVVNAFTIWGFYALLNTSALAVRLGFFTALACIGNVIGYQLQISGSDMTVYNDAFVVLIILSCVALFKPDKTDAINASNYRIPLFASGFGWLSSRIVQAS